MSNKNLYLHDEETGDRILIAKSFGSGWSVRLSQDTLQEWLDEKCRDRCSFGNVNDNQTNLKLVAE